MRIRFIKPDGYQYMMIVDGIAFSMPTRNFKDVLKAKRRNLHLWNKFRKLRNTSKYYADELDKYERRVEHFRAYRMWVHEYLQWSKQNPRKTETLRIAQSSTESKATIQNGETATSQNPYK